MQGKDRQEHQNAFGFLRLLFALLVVVSHAPELADGNRSREILTQVFGTISFGELAVDAFFVISGYLIVQSYLQSSDVAGYFRKRIARIYPAFLVSSAICTVLVAALTGASDPVSSGVRALSLQEPLTPSPFLTLSYAAINGAVWTIAVEFRCYILIAVLGLAGLLKRPKSVALLAAVSYMAFVIGQHADFQHFHDARHSTALMKQLRLASIFLTGAAFYLWRDRLAFSRKRLAAAVALLILGLYRTETAEAAVAVMGGYLILYVAKHAKALNAINNRNDVSYGLYLYAWPIQQLVLFSLPQLPLLLSGLLTAAFAYCAGWLSWQAIERPALLKFARRPQDLRPTRTLMARAA